MRRMHRLLDQSDRRAIRDHRGRPLMNVRNGVRYAVPGIYQRASRAYNIFRLAGDIYRQRVDLGLLREVMIKSAGTFKKECPLCGFTGFFEAFGNPPRWDARCPSCGSLERHRQLGLLLRNTPSILTNSTALLHFAPEPCLTPLLRKCNIQYTSADLGRPDVDLKLNLEDTKISNEQYDLIICSHVLQYVSDDTRALLELRRILMQDGIVIIMVPIREGCDTTYEDETVKDRNSRLIHFGEEGFLRVYGSDFIQKLTDVGFRVRAYTAFGKEAVKFGLIMGEKILLCTK
jgi:hypothetical protein